MATPADPVNPDQIPHLNPFSGPRPTLPSTFTCSALLHPFAPPPEPGSQPNVPFYQLCTADIWYVENRMFLTKITGVEYGNWWYLVQGDQTLLSIDGGSSWNPVDSGWALNGTDPLGPSARCAGQLPLNWMNAQNASWWVSPVTVPGNDATGATWMWFDTETNAPVRVMFGVQPASPTTGTPDQLPVLQNFSFTYFTNFQSSYTEQHGEDFASADPATLEGAGVFGLQPGNPDGYPLWEWATNQSFTVLMTPVNEKFDPLPTRVLYRWDPDPFTETSVRSQSTLMRYDPPVPPEAYSYQLALLQRHSPPARNYDAFYDAEGNLVEPKSNDPFPFDTEPPNWVALGDGQIKGTLANNPDLCPGTTVTIGAVMFPPATPNYPQGTYLWTWYSPLDGTLSRPVVFMQSASSLGLGTSLALADYYDFVTYDQPIDAENFVLPQNIPIPNNPS